MSSRFFFKQLQHPINAMVASSLVYAAPSRAQTEAFNKLNGLAANEMIYPGRVLVAPSLDGVREPAAASVTNMCQALSYSHRNAKSPPASKTFNNSFFGALLSPSASDLLGGSWGAALNTLQLRNTIANNLDEVSGTLNRIGDNVLKIHLGEMELRKAPNMSVRHSVEQLRRTVQESVQELPKKISNLNSVALSASDASQLSLSDATRSFMTDGSPLIGQRNGQFLEKVDDVVREVEKRREFIAIPLGPTRAGQALTHLAKHADAYGAGATGLTAGYDIYKMYGSAADAEKRYGSGAAEVVKVHQSAKIAGSVTAGSIAGGLGAIALTKAAAPLLLMGPVGWGGLAVMSLCVAGATYIASKGGEAAGGYIAEESLKSAAPEQAEFVETVVDFSNDPVPIQEKK